MPRILVGIHTICFKYLGFKMQNYFVILDEFGNYTQPDIYKKALRNLQRFDLEVSEIQVESDFRELRKLADDFYITWNASSTELVKAIGFEKCCALFELFRDNFMYTWPPEAVELFEIFGTEGSVEVFRGESPSLVAQGIQGISWTTYYDVAEYYAKCHHDGIILTGTVSMEHILIYFSEEYEIVARRCNVKVKC